MSQSSDGAEASRARQRPPWLAPVVIVGGLVVIALICVGLSVWGP